MNFYKEWKLSKFKFLSIQFDFKIFTNLAEWFGFSIGFKTQCDHPRFEFESSCLRIVYLDIKIYDSRHYNELY